MDFEKLLHVARKNELAKKEQPVKCLQTKFKPPTKEQRDKDRILSEGVQKFLARKEEEERRKKKEDAKRKEELQALRAKDPKANKRIQTMLKRTKSANKSVMEDAVDNNNTADTLAGPSQPDEDDYGFVSESSSELYNKLIQKMYSGPSDDAPKFAPSKKPKAANLMNTKERVKMALLKQEEEERLPHKRKRKHKGEEVVEEQAGLDYSAPDRDLGTAADIPKDKARERDKHKFKRPMPPPVDFHELLKIAEQKQHQPVVYEPKVQKKEPETLMTKKQKAEYDKQQEWKRQRELRLQALANGTKLPEPRENGKPEKPAKVEQKLPNPKPQNGVRPPVKPVEREPVRSSSSNESIKSAPKPKMDKTRPVEMQDKTSKAKDLDEETRQLKRERDEALRILKEKEQLIKERDEAVKKLKEREKLIKERDEAMRKLKLLEESERKAPKEEKPSVAKPSKPTSTLQKPSNPPPKRPPQQASQSVTSREFPPKDVRRPGMSQKGGREFPPRDVLRRPPADLKRKAPPPKRNGVIDSEEEYDSELDDFIDDGDDGCQEDVSKVISEIFRYDKHKYSRYDDDDQECMESNYMQISKEEFYSTKCGIMEDLEDIQKEKAELARKKKAMKR